MTTIASKTLTISTQPTNQTPGSNGSIPLAPLPPASLTSTDASNWTQPDTITDPARLVQLIAFVNQIKSEAEQREKELKAQLEALHAKGLIDNTAAFDRFTVTRSERKTWEYDTATKATIKTIQEMAQLDGIATQKVSVTWSLRQAK